MKVTKVVIKKKFPLNMQFFQMCDLLPNDKNSPTFKKKKKPFIISKRKERPHFPSAKRLITNLKTVSVIHKRTIKK